MDGRSLDINGLNNKRATELLNFARIILCTLVGSSYTS